MSAVPVVRILPCEAHQCPGFDFVEINESDFDPQIHKLFGAAEGKPSEGLKVEQLKAALDAKGIEHKAGMSKPELAALLDAA